ncbi:hypothetical protein [Comamonas terrigena]|uniref:AbiU2 domain-containing protein n=1 Tax=Comamonas terrigena TaxID=32013 RepID=UPI000FD6A514|nr:hypothetical protein [Comamonas terrigena]BBL24992.1 hypothetical protein CT3_24470 [Comamonas terrigena NBRC 13299]
MTKAQKIASTLIEEGNKARAHFQVWWALRNKSLPKYYETMNDSSYVDFFHVSNSGHYTLFLLSLAKIFDRDSRVAGIQKFKQALCTEGMNELAESLSQALAPYQDTVENVMRIRNKSVAHNEHSITREDVYRLNGVTPNELQMLIDAACQAINETSRELGINNLIFDGNRAEKATFNMLKALSKGRK